MAEAAPPEATPPPSAAADPQEERRRKQKAQARRMVADDSDSDSDSEAPQPAASARPESVAVEVPPDEPEQSPLIAPANAREAEQGAGPTTASPAKSSVAKTPSAAPDTEPPPPPPPYPASLYALRLLVPNLLAALWIVFLTLACFGTTPNEETFAGPTKTFQVGPGCVLPPAPPPASDDLVAACPAGPPGRPLGPQILPTGMTPDYKKLLAPEKTSDESWGEAPAVFHWLIQATTRAASCKEAAAAGTSAGVPSCEGGPECSVHAFAGELFLTLSPSWIHAASFGLLEADTSRIELTLVEGWDACLPTAPAPGMHPLDALVAHMFSQAGRGGAGFIGREDWPATSVDGHGAFADLSPSANATYFTVLDLATPDDGPYAYQVSGRVKTLAVLFFAAVLSILIAGYQFFWGWEARQTGKEFVWVRLFFPQDEIMDLEELLRKRAAAVARLLRREIKKHAHAASAEATGIDAFKLSVGGIHAAVRDYLQADLFHPRKDGERRVFCVDKAMVQKNPSLKSKPRFPVDGLGLPEHRGANKDLTKDDFVACLLPKLQALQASRVAAAGDAQPNSSCGRLCSWLCHDRDHFEKELCGEIFGVVNGGDERTGVSVDELFKFIVYYTEDTDDDGVKTEADSDSGSDDEDEPDKRADDVDEEDQSLKVEDSPLLQETSTDKLGARPSGLNFAADLIFGGPNKVTQKCGLVLLVGLIQGGFVLAPVLVPMLMVWQRGWWENPDGELYPIEDFPVIGSLKHVQHSVFWLGLFTLVSGMVENVAYTVLGRQLHWHRRRQQAKKKEAAEAAQKEKAEDDAKKEQADDTEESDGLERWWAIKGASAVVWKLCLFLCGLATLFLLVELVVIIVVAVTVDPWRPLTATAVICTIVFYIVHSISAFTKMRKKFVAGVKARYLAKHKDLTDAKDKKKIMAKLSELIQDEVEANGLSFGGIAIAVFVGLCCVSLLLSTVLVAQSLFWSERGTSIGQLIATVIPCITVVASTVKSSIDKDRKIEEHIDDIEATAEAVVKGAKEAGRVARTVVQPREGSPEWKAMERRKERQAAWRARRAGPEPEPEPQPEA